MPGLLVVGESGLAVGCSSMDPLVGALASWKATCDARWVRVCLSLHGMRGGTVHAVWHVHGVGQGKEGPQAGGRESGD